MNRIYAPHRTAFNGSSLGNAAVVVKGDRTVNDMTNSVHAN